MGRSETAFNTFKKLQQGKTRKWQSASKKLIQVAQSHLLGPNGKERLSYLIHERGLNIDTIRQHQLGWLQAKGGMPSKLLIPCHDSHGCLIRIRFRIDNPDPGQERYRISKSSNPKPPFPLGVSSGIPVIILESELDTILIAQEAGDHVGVLGVGTTGTKLNQAVTHYLTEKIPIVLIISQLSTGVFDCLLSGFQELSYFTKSCWYLCRDIYIANC